MASVIYRLINPVFHIHTDVINIGCGPYRFTAVLRHFLIAELRGCTFLFVTIGIFLIFSSFIKLVRGPQVFATSRSRRAVYGCFYDTTFKRSSAGVRLCSPTIRQSYTLPTTSPTSTPLCKSYEVKVKQLFHRKWFVTQ